MKLNFLSSSLLYVLDNFTISLGGYLFWLIIPRYASASDIGHASSIISIVTLISSFAVLGLEYPMLKRAEKEGKRILGTLLVLEAVVLLALVPLITIYILLSIEQTSIELILISASFLMLSGTAFITRYILLGVLDITKVLIFDFASVAARYIVAIPFLIGSDNGVTPIIASYLAQQIILGGLLTAVVIKKVGIQVNLKDRVFVRELLVDGLINFSSKFSKIIISSLSIVLLTLLGFSPAVIGTFYIPLIIGLAIGGFAANVATVALPTSSMQNKDYTFHSIRFSLLIIVPIIALMIIISEDFLRLINDSYVAADTELKILSIASFPFAIVMNVIAFLNYNKRMKELAKLGIVEVALFLGTLFPLAATMGTVGVALSILIAFSGSMIVAIYWMGRTALRYSMIGLASIGCGFAASYLASNLIVNAIALGVIAALASTAVLFATRIISMSEIRHVISRR